MRRFVINMLYFLLAMPMYICILICVIYIKLTGLVFAITGFSKPYEWLEALDSYIHSIANKYF